MLKNFLVYIAVIVAMSLLCITINNVLFVEPELNRAMTSVTDVITKTTDVVKRNSGELYIQRSEVEEIITALQTQSDINKHVQEYLFYLDNKYLLQNEVNKMFFEMFKVQDERLMALTEEVETLKRRHIELLRAIAILKKEKKILEGR